MSDQTCKIGYLTESDAAADSFDSNLFYAVNHLPARSKIVIKLYYLKKCQINLKSRLKRALPTSNAIRSKHWTDLLSSLESTGKRTAQR